MVHWPRTLKGRLQLQGQSKPLRSFDVYPVGEVEVGELGDSELVAWCKREDVTLPIPTIPGISLSYTRLGAICTPECHRVQSQMCYLQKI
ncbi:hypothetical protein BVRB_7g172280 [Beta vulgaris subsp. vulgaris]|nr:hypothetical protein BVRB_7g172280 [Beta vulgaris subsp. vulgaris]